MCRVNAHPLLGFFRIYIHDSASQAVTSALLSFSHELHASVSLMLMRVQGFLGIIRTLMSSEVKGQLLGIHVQSANSAPVFSFRAGFSSTSIEISTRAKSSCTSFLYSATPLAISSPYQSPPANPTSLLLFSRFIFK